MFGAPARRRLSSSAAIVAGALVLAAGCEERPSLIERVTSEPSASAAPAPPQPLAWTTMPEMFVDELGVYIGSRRADPSNKEGAAKLKELVAGLPIKPDTEIALEVKRNAETADLAAFLVELGHAGAPRVVVKTGGRADLPETIVLVPETRIENPDDCSIVLTVTDDLSTKLWPFSGKGVALRHKKGFGGPDLTATEKAVTDKLEQCDSKTAFFGATDKLKWELCFFLGALITKADTAKKIDKLVLLGDTPVAGQPVKLRE